MFGEDWRRFCHVLGLGTQELEAVFASPDSLASLPDSPVHTG